MFGRSPIADIAHLLTSAPVDIDTLTRHGDPARADILEATTAELPTAEQRYRKALALARLRLIGESHIRAIGDQFLIDLINHHARSILMPRDLVLAAAAGGTDMAELAEIFQVPLDAAERRLRDSDLRQTSLEPVQNASR
jgi:hypothetical protein